MEPLEPSDPELRALASSVANRAEGLGRHLHPATLAAVADLLRDQRLLMDARDDAIALVREDPHLKAPAHELLKRRVSEVFLKPGRLGLVDVG